jgi:hypothetical protein
MTAEKSTSDMSEKEEREDEDGGECEPSVTLCQHRRALTLSRNTL